MNILPEMDISLVEAFLGPFEKKTQTFLQNLKEEEQKLTQWKNTIHCNIMAII